MRKQGGGIIGKIIGALFLVISLAFIGLLYYTQMIPTVYLAVIGAFVLILVLLVGTLTWNRHKLVRFIIGIILAVILSVVYILGSVYIYQTTSAISNISGVSTEISQVGIYVRADDTAQSLEDTAGYTYGILADLDRDNTDTAITMLPEQVSAGIQTVEYSGLTELIDGLTGNETGAILLNQAYVDIIEEISGYSSLDSMIRQIAVENVETAIEKSSVDTTQQTDTEEIAQKTTTGTDDVYTIFVSGIDNRGGIVAKSRSDVNIIVTANMTTRQLLLVSTPRDYYVPLSISNGVPDKLTHAGIYGINVCMDTLGMLYDMDINYYVRLNFDGFINIIDALGGITVNSDYEFDTQNTTGYHFNEGANEVDGAAALAFARERYAFTEGDRQRGRNQMAVIEGVIDKALSPELLKNYSSILSSVQDCFETNISYETIARLLQKQLATGGSWNVVSYSVDGTGDTQKPYSMSSTAYVMVPDYTTVEHAKELMQQVRDGEIISQE
jgi:LCP family protein required for cell wall assembly